MLNQPDIAKLLLRLTLGVLMLFHGIAKLTHGIGFIEGLVVAKGLPAFVAWGVYVGEIVAPLLLIAGVQVRIAAAIVAFNMLAAIVLVHMGDIFVLTDHGGWRLELQGFFLMTAVALILLGGGKYAVQKS
ncbi:MAG: DoxX family protein [Pseudomonadota bacterium]